MALFYLLGFENEVYALSNNDSFSCVNVLVRGLVWPPRCTNSAFSMRTGAFVENSSVQVTRWPARIREGRVKIGLLWRITG